MRNGKVQTNEWETPQDFYDKYNSIYHFELDAAASAENKKAPLYYDIKINGLAQPWAPLTTWVNPPYQNILAWVKKAYEESLKGCTVVMLLPSGTDTCWFHDYVLKYGTVEFIKGRLTFGGAKNSAMSPSIIVVFK